MVRPLAAEQLTVSRRRFVCDDRIGSVRFDEKLRSLNTTRYVTKSMFYVSHKTSYRLRQVEKQPPLQVPPQPEQLPVQDEHVLTHPYAQAAVQPRLHDVWHPPEQLVQPPAQPPVQPVQPPAHAPVQLFPQPPPQPVHPVQDPTQPPAHVTTQALLHPVPQLLPQEALQVLPQLFVHEVEQVQLQPLQRT